MLKVLDKDGWNHYVIRAESRHVTQILNGLKTVDYLEPDESLSQEGLFGLQLHGGTPQEGHFKDIYIWSSQLPTRLSHQYDVAATVQVSRRRGAIP